MANPFGGFGDNQGFSGFDQAPQGSSGLTVDELLNVARLQGGRVAEVAEELANPRRSMMATIGSGMKNAFTGFLDLIAAPGQIVAGAISSKHTIGEALEKNISVSDIVFGDKDVKDASMGVKVQDFISRTAVDVLTDPLTFLTFGATRGILGISAAPKFFAGEKTATAMGLKNVGDKAFLSEFGEKMADDYVQALAKGNKQGFFLSKRDEILEEFGSKMDDADKLQMHLGLKEFDDEMSEVLTKNILNGRLRQHDAINTIGRLIEKHPALIETFVDKGGIKFFSKTILSSQRIRGIKAVIPGTTMLDEFTAPMRNAAGAAFNRSYRLDPNVKGGGGRISDEAIHIEQKWKDMSESMNNELLLKASNLYSDLKITKHEDQFITAAIELGLEPADARNSQIWAKLNGIDKAGPIRDEVWRANGFVKEQLTYNYNKLREAGVSVSNLDNYFPHIAVKQKVGGIGFRTPPKKVAAGSKFAKASVLMDDAGTRFPTYFTSKPPVGGGKVEAMVKQGEETVKKTFAVQGEIYTDVVTGKALSRARATIPEARELGIEFADSSLTGMLLGSMDAIKVSVGRNFMKEMGEKMGKSASLAPDGYRKVSMTGIKMDGVDVAKSMVDDAGEELYFHPLIAKQIEEFSGAIAQDEATETIMKSYDKMQNVFKATVTSIFPAFHGRNAISNVMLNLLDIGHNAINPVRNVEAGNMIFLNSKMAGLHRKMLKAGVRETDTKKIADLTANKEIYKNTVVHLPEQGVYAKVDIDTAQYLHNEVGNIPFTAEDAVHISQIERVTTGGRAMKEISIEEASKLSPNTAKAISGAKVAGEGTQAAREYSELMGREMFTDDKGYKWSFGELRTVMHNNVVAFHPRNLGQIDQAQFGRDNVTEIAEKLFPTSKSDKAKVMFKNVNPFSTKNVAVKTGLKVGSLVEDYSRTLNFMSNLKATGDPLLAAERTKMFLFDYQNLSNFERNVMRRIIPFYTFSRKNLELQVKTLFQRPGAIAGEIRAVQTIGDTLGGGDLTDEERAALPEWMRGGINTVLSREGSHVTLLSTIGSPIEQPFQQLQPNQLLASVSPLLRVGPELLMGYSMFHGKAISEVTNAAAFKDAPEAIKDFIGYTEVTGVNKDGQAYTYYTSLRPSRMHLLLNLPPTSRVISEIKGLQKPGVDTSIKAWDFLVGFNPYDMDLESEALKRENEMKDELINVLEKSNAEIYSFERTIIPKEIKQEAGI